jgi:LacI family transcriptional regulator
MISLPTLKDVAKLACVDVSTVSRALNNNPCVHAETKKRIMDAVEKLAYRPNLLARGLRQGKRHSVGIVVPHLHLSVFSMIAQSIEKTLRDAGYSSFLCSVEDNPIAERDSLNRLRNGLVDGIIIAGTGKNKKLIQDIHSSGLAVTQVIRIQDNSLNSVTVDYYKCGYEAVHFLYKKGCRHIGLITGSLKLSPYKFRYHGYRDAMMELGLREVTAEAKKYSNLLDYGYKAAKEMLDSHPEIDAIIAAMDAQGIGALRALKEAHKKVPQEVKVISLTGHEIGSMLETTMTTMEMPAVEIGKKAAELILSEIESKDKGETPVERVVYTSKLIEREST